MTKIQFNDGQTGLGIINSPINSYSTIFDLRNSNLRRLTLNKGSHFCCFWNIYPHVTPCLRLLCDLKSGIVTSVNQAWESKVATLPPLLMPVNAPELRSAPPLNPHRAFEKSPWSYFDWGFLARFALYAVDDNAGSNLSCWDVHHLHFTI